MMLIQRTKNQGDTITIIYPHLKNTDKPTAFDSRIAVSQFSGNVALDGEYFTEDAWLELRAAMDKAFEIAGND